MEWISARQAVEGLGAPADSRFRLREHDVIYQHASDGLVRHRARLFIHATPGQPEVRSRDTMIPDEFWLIDRHVGFQTDWLTGRFTVKPYANHRDVEWRAYGVQFCKEDLEAIGGKFSTSVMTEDRESKPRRGRAGPNPQMDRWHSFYMAVVQIAHEDRLNKACFPSQTSLWEEIALEMGDGAWDPDYAKRYVSQIYKKFVGG